MAQRTAIFRGRNDGLGTAKPIAGNPQFTPQPRQPDVDAYQGFVGLVTEYRDPAMVARDLVELVAMNEQEAPAVDRFMHQFVDHLDLAEDNAAVVAQRLVVVAGDEHDSLAVPRPAQQLLDHGILRLSPADAAPHRPEIDDVADQESLFGRVFAQEIEQTLRLARPGAEVDVG